MKVLLVRCIQTSDRIHFKQLFEVLSKNYNSRLIHRLILTGICIFEVELNLNISVLQME